MPFGQPGAARARGGGGAKLKGNGKTIQLWGMTELQAGSFSRPSDPADVRHGTAGAATPGTELRVVEERLQVRRAVVFRYLNNPEATREAFTRTAGSRPATPRN